MLALPEDGVERRALCGIEGRGEIARALAAGAATNFVIVRTDLSGAGEVPITTFSATGASSCASFGLPMLVAEWRRARRHSTIERTEPSERALSEATTPLRIEPPPVLRPV
jgi:hypothetical protein